MSLDVDEWAEELDGAPTAPAEDPSPPPRFATLPEFVEHLADWYRREVYEGYERTWCPEWWRHPEAVIRMEAMWRAFESLRQDPATGLSVWIRDHVDVHMARLLDPAGPLKGCTAVGGHGQFPQSSLPLTDPPAEWWTEADTGL